MNRIKVVVQCVIIILPLLFSLIIPIEFLWLTLEVLFDREFSDLQDYLDPDFRYDKLASVIIGFVFTMVLLILFKQINKDKLFNKGSNYHNYPIIYFFLASEVLGYNKVSLIRVPVYLQFKILFKDWFTEVIIDDQSEKDEEPKIKEFNMFKKNNEINLVLSDTYKIEYNELPIDKKELPTMYIERNTGFPGNRTYNPNFTKSVREQTNNLRNKYTRVNIFATTNTQNTKEIVLQSFKNAGRTGFEYIYVYEQDEEYKFTIAHEIKN